MSAAGKKIPVLVSPDVVMDGVPTAPALNTAPPVPLGAMTMLPFVLSSIVILPEFVPALVLRIRSP